MPFNYKSPGVYVEEVDKGARPIESAGTSVLAMIGFCRDNIMVEKMVEEVDEKSGEKVQRMRLVSQPVPDQPTLVTNWTQFTDKYGDVDQSLPGFYLHDAMFGFFLNGGTQAFVVGLPVRPGGQPAAAKAQAQPQITAGEANLAIAGSDKVLRLTTGSAAKPGEPITVETLPAGEGAPEGSFNMVIRRGSAEPQTISNLNIKSGKGLRNVTEVLTKDTNNLLNAELLDAALLADRMPAQGQAATLVAMQQTAALTPAETAPAATQANYTKEQITSALAKGNAAQRTGVAGLEAIDEITLVAFPDAVAAYEMGLFSEDDIKSVQTLMINHCEGMKDRFAILDCPPNMQPQDMIDWRKNRMNFDSKYAALYYPWIKTNSHLVPPSGHVAGVYARVDGERGVHKAPANEIVRGVIGLERNVSRNEQDLLNPIGVNCIRSFPGQGIRIWGARTLSSDAQWRYINVRRLFSNVEESILQGTNWIVFEPNDDILWRQIKRDIGSYLTVVWRSGALFGTTPEQAFYVKCDAETNPPDLRDLGYCIVEVGMAPVKPAEFVVFRISQMRDGAGSASE